VITLALFLFYWLVLTPAGFIVSSAIVIIGLGFAFRERMTWRVLIFSIAFPVVVDLIFRKAANVWLPAAPWG
ncbi:MAG: tripartite tricarboxylate transporter TctB family protein, partial [Betaproteobacteria bacterium]